MRPPPTSSSSRRHLRAVLDRIVGQLEEGPGQRRGRFRAVGHVPHVDAGQAVEPVIGRAVDLDHQHAPLDQLDERHEQLAVEPVLVEVARRPVRGGHDLAPRRSSNLPNSRDRIIASAGLVTCISSKHEQSRFGGDLLRRPARSDRLPRSRARSRSRPWVSSMKAWKWTRRFGSTADVCRTPGPSASICRARPRPTDRLRRGPSSVSNRAAARASRRTSSLRAKPVERRDGARLRRIGLELAGGDQLRRRPPGPARSSRSARWAGSLASACR